MREYQIRIVDAFTGEPFAGNPCAVLLDADDLSDERMQTIAGEMNLSETAFVLRSHSADFRVRFFTPSLEIPMAGHPTIATVHALVEAERLVAAPEGTTEIRMELNSGVLPLRVELREGVPRIRMTQSPPVFGGYLEPERFASALGIELADIRDDVPVQVVSTGTRQAMVPVRSLEALRRIRPDYGKLAALEDEHAYFSAHVFAMATIEPAHRVHSRHFGANAGFGEDPVTGSASGSMAAYLWRHGLLRERKYAVEQGHLMGRPGIVEVELDAEGDDIRSVSIAGQAVTVMRGTLTA